MTVSTQQMIYDAPDNLPLRELKAWLSGSHSVTTEPEAKLMRVYLDTFDWRLLQSGSVLEASFKDGRYLLTWRELQTGRILINRMMRQVPRFAHDLSAPGLRDRLESVLGERTLMPQVSVTSNTQTLCLHNNEEKTLLRVELRHDHVLAPQSTGYFKLPTRVHLFPFRGYEPIYKKQLHQLTAKGRLRTITEDPLLTALDFLEIRPAEFCNQPNVQLTPEQPAYQALGNILQGFLRILKQNVEGACQDKDPEFLHDFLTAARRIQCLLNRFSPIFPEQELALIRQDFGWIEQVTTSVRDIDIYLSLYGDFAARLDSVHRAALRSLHQYLKELKFKQQRQMRVSLESPRFNRLIQLFEQFLEHNLSRRNPPPAATKPILELANTSILRLYRDLRTRGRGITADSPTDELIELHQICKRLGYQMEIFRGLYPEKKISALIAGQERLESCLNRFHDLNLQHDALLDYRTRMKQEQRVFPAGLEAIDLLVADRAKERHIVQKQYADRFEQLSKKKINKRFVSLFSDSSDRRKD